ncbi:hypothetical protein FS837_006374 [Tulasnella sp. UAMH 9824]|nr:hypothetical protein FS837_006374 [Tulasnella sp. UAMH 9824]
MFKLRQKNKQLAAARSREAAVAAAGVRVDFSLRRSRDFDEETLASSKFSIKEGLELSVIESQTETKKPELYSTDDPKYVPFHVYLDALDFASVRLPVSNLFYHGSNLGANEQHTVTVQPARILESVVVEMDFGDKVDMKLSMNDVQLFQQEGFVATGQWNTNPCLGAGQSRVTCLVSEGTGSEISYTFQGDAITLWGAAENTNSLYQVSVDGVLPIFYSPSNTTRSNLIIPLAHYSDLGPGSHTIKLTSMPKDGKARIEVTYAHVYTKLSATSDSPTTTGESNPAAAITSLIGEVPQPQAASHLSKAAIIAIVVGTLLGVLALIGLLFMFKLRQKNKQLAAARSREAAVAAAGVRVDFSLRRSRDFDEETLASSKFSIKEGLELSVIESQTETKKPE